MNISPINNDYNVSMQGNNKNPNWFKRQLRRVGQIILDMSPTHTSKDDRETIKKWDKTKNWVSHPMWNRGIMGATALLSQPTIDYYNHRVDDETRTVSRNRTIAKIIAGTLVGMFVVRGPVHKVVQKMTDITGKKKYSQWLLPKDFIQQLKKDKEELSTYRATLAMIIALGAMCITNFVLDAPLTIILTNLLNEKSGLNQKNKNTASQAEKKEVVND